jgi:hypothetical protein
VLELAFRGRIAMEKDPARRRFPLADRNIEVIDDTLTGEVLLDEALKMMKQSEKMSVSSWIDLMSGITPLLSSSIFSPPRQQCSFCNGDSSATFYLHVHDQWQLTLSLLFG